MTNRVEFLLGDIFKIVGCPDQPEINNLTFMVTKISEKSLKTKCKETKKEVIFTKKDNGEFTLDESDKEIRGTITFLGTAAPDHKYVTLMRYKVTEFVEIEFVKENDMDDFPVLKCQIVEVNNEDENDYIQVDVLSPYPYNLEGNQTLMIEFEESGLPVEIAKITRISYVALDENLLPEEEEEDDEIEKYQRYAALPVQTNDLIRILSQKVVQTKTTSKEILLQATRFREMYSKFVNTEQMKPIRWVKKAMAEKLFQVTGKDIEWIGNNYKHIVPVAKCQPHANFQINRTNPPPTDNLEPLTYDNIREEINEFANKLIVGEEMEALIENGETGEFRNVVTSAEDEVTEVPLAVTFLMAKFSDPIMAHFTKSLILLPFAAIMYSNIHLSSSTILEKTNLGMVPMLKKTLFFQEEETITDIILRNVETELKSSVGKIARHIHVKPVGQQNAVIPFINLANNANSIYCHTMAKKVELTKKEKNEGDIESHKMFSSLINSLTPSIIEICNFIHQSNKERVTELPSIARFFYTKRVFTLYDFIAFVAPFGYSKENISHHQAIAIYQILVENQQKYQQCAEFRKNQLQKIKESMTKEAETFFTNYQNNVKSLIQTLCSHEDTKQYLDELLQLYSLTEEKEFFSSSEWMNKIIKTDGASVFNALVKFAHEHNFLEEVVEQIEGSQGGGKKETESIFSLQIQKLNDQTCFYLAKRYSNRNHLERDNNTIIYLDKEFNYAPEEFVTGKLKEIIEVNKKKKIPPPQIIGLITTELTSIYQFKPKPALDLATRLYYGKKIPVEEGMYCVLDYGDSKTYYRRKKNQWELDILVNDSSFKCFQEILSSIKKEKIENLFPPFLKPKEILKKRGGQAIQLAGDAHKKAMDRLFQRSKRALAIKQGSNKKQKHVENIKPPEISPNKYYYDSILATENLTEKYQKVLILAKHCRYSEQEKDPWMYCQKTNLKLLPLFLVDLANNYPSEEYEKTLFKYTEKAAVVQDVFIHKPTQTVICKITQDPVGYQATVGRRELNDENEDMGEEDDDDDDDDFVSSSNLVASNTSSFFPTTNRIFNTLCNAAGVKINDSADVSLLMDQISKFFGFTSEESYFEISQADTRNFTTIFHLIKQEEDANEDDLFNEIQRFKNFKLILLITMVLLSYLQIKPFQSFKPLRKFDDTPRNFQGIPFGMGDNETFGIAYMAKILAIHFKDLLTTPYKYFSEKYLFNEDGKQKLVDGLKLKTEEKEEKKKIRQTFDENKKLVAKYTTMLHGSNLFTMLKTFNEKMFLPSQTHLFFKKLKSAEKIKEKQLTSPLEFPDFLPPFTNALPSKILHEMLANKKADYEKENKLLQDKKEKLVDKNGILKDPTDDNKWLQITQDMQHVKSNFTSYETEISKKIQEIKSIHLSDPGIRDSNIALKSIHIYKLMNEEINKENNKNKKASESEETNATFSPAALEQNDDHLENACFCELLGTQKKSVLESFISINNQIAVKKQMLDKMVENISSFPKETLILTTFKAKVPPTPHEFEKKMIDTIKYYCNINSNLPIPYYLEALFDEEKRISAEVFDKYLQDCQTNGTLKEVYEGLEKELFKANTIKPIVYSANKEHTIDAMLREEVIISPTSHLYSCKRILKLIKEAIAINEQVGSAYANANELEKIKLDLVTTSTNSQTTFSFGKIITVYDKPPEDNTPIRLKFKKQVFDNPEEIREKNIVLRNIARNFTTLFIPKLLYDKNPKLDVKDFPVFPFFKGQQAKIIEPILDTLNKKKKKETICNIKPNLEQFQEEKKNQLTELDLLMEWIIESSRSNEFLTPLQQMVAVTQCFRAIFQIYGEYDGMERTFFRTFCQEYLNATEKNINGKKTNFMLVEEGVYENAQKELTKKRAIERFAVICKSKQGDVESRRADAALNRMFVRDPNSQKFHTMLQENKSFYE